MKDRISRLEEGAEVKLNFRKMAAYFVAGGKEKNLMPAVVQDAETGEVLILAYVNRAALNYSLRHRVAAFWSTTRNELWIKGLTSGCYLELQEVRVNCEQNSLLYLVRPVNGVGACHTKKKGGYRKSCYYRKMSVDGKTLKKLGGKSHEKAGISAAQRQPGGADS